MSLVPLLAFSLVWNFSPLAASQEAPAPGAGNAESAGPENYDIRHSKSKSAQIKKEKHARRRSSE
ncbi:MAG TPA: hypothetical protein VEQ42_02735, partial [Pyrinomonadaceae bacterium]|nr:hypothetical protein [Pyrinomonadaceae bacterium]